MKYPHAPPIELREIRAQGLGIEVVSREHEGGALFRRRRFRLPAGILTAGILVAILPANSSAAAPALTSKALTAASDPVADGSMTEEDKALADAQAE
ncbi:hypothetical protein [Streptomyces sp. 3214.6]|uniref:hypothetical protein n=1 Tax=Streptomyces sp. 3214.6 TaxID=1882757 RepID=UPI00117DC801|nr:hypothetical protein [Streptomyces sp. 3214.6]